MQSGDLIFEACHFDFGNIALLTVGPIQSSKIARDAGIDLFNPRLDLVHCEVLITIVHGLELAAINGNHSSTEQAEPAAQHHELAAHSTNCRTIVAAEIGNRFEVWH